MTVEDLLETKGNRQPANIQVAREEEGNTASDASMEMISTAFIQ